MLREGVLGIDARMVDSLMIMAFRFAIPPYDTSFVTD